MRLRGRVEVVHVDLKLVAIRVGVVKTGAHAVVHRPVRQDAQRLLLLVGGDEVREALKGESNVVETTHGLLVAGSLVVGCFHNHQPVVFVVVGDHGRLGTFEYESPSEELEVPIHHLVKLLGSGSQAKVCHVLWVQEAAVILAIVNVVGAFGFCIVIVGFGHVLFFYLNE